MKFPTFYTGIDAVDKTDTNVVVIFMSSQQELSAYCHTPKYIEHLHRETGYIILRYQQRILQQLENDNNQSCCRSVLLTSSILGKV